MGIGQDWGCREFLAPGPDVLCWTPRDMDSAAFEILSTFPPTVYQDDAVTLRAAGLVPNATLLLRTRRALLSNPGSGPGSLP